MKIEQIYTNCLAQAAYYIESNGEAAVIDPLRDTDAYIKMAKDGGAEIKYVFETHFHADFVSGYMDLADKTGAKVVYGPDAKIEKGTILNASDGEMFSLGAVKIKILHTPGHTPESTTYLLIDADGKNHAIFTGDTLFIGDVGRPDLAVNKDISKEVLAGVLYDSLRSKIMPLEDHLIVYPGHGPGSACGKNMSKETFSTLGDQKKNNYALQDISKEEFVKKVTTGILPPPQYFPGNVMLNMSGSKSIDKVVEHGLNELSVEEIEKEIERGAVVLDTRHQKTFKNGFIPGSINIGLDGTFAVWAGTIIADINMPIIILAEEGREKESIVRLARVGLDNSIGYIKGGINAWAESGRKIDQIESVASESIGEQINRSETVILDVRKPAEFNAGHVKSAKNFPLDVMNDHLQELDKEKAYYVYCKGGYRSMMASSILKANGFKDVLDIAGGFDAILKSAALEIV